MNNKINSLVWPGIVVTLSATIATGASIDWTGASSGSPTKIMPRSRSAVLRIETRIVARLSQIHWPVAATKENGQWLWIADDGSSSEKAVEGWINKNDVKQLSEALDYYNKELRKTPEDAALHWLRAIVLEDQGQKDAAYTDYDFATRNNPELEDAWLGHARTNPNILQTVAIESAKLDAAFKDAMDALVNPPYVPRAAAAVRRMLSSIYVTASAFDLVETEYHRAQSHNRTVPRSYLAMGDHFKQRAEFATKTVGNWNQIADKATGAAAGLHGVAVRERDEQIRHARNMWRDAIDQYRIALEQNSSWGLPHLALAQAYQKNSSAGSQDAFRVAIEDTLRLIPKSKDAYISLAENELARCQCAAPGATYANAITYGIKACQLTYFRDAKALNSLARAYYCFPAPAVPSSSNPCPDCSASMAFQRAIESSPANVARAKPQISMASVTVPQASDDKQAFLSQRAPGLYTLENLSGVELIEPSSSPAPEQGLAPTETPDANDRATGRQTAVEPAAPNDSVGQMEAAEKHPFLRQAVRYEQLAASNAAQIEDRLKYQHTYEDWQKDLLAQESKSFAYQNRLAQVNKALLDHNESEDENSAAKIKHDAARPDADNAAARGEATNVNREAQDLERAVEELMTAAVNAADLAAKLRVGALKLQDEASHLRAEGDQRERLGQRETAPTILDEIAKLRAKAREKDALAETNNASASQLDDRAIELRLLAERLKNNHNRAANRTRRSNEEAKSSGGQIHKRPTANSTEGGALHTDVFIDAHPISAPARSTPPFSGSKEQLQQRRDALIRSIKAMNYSEALPTYGP